MFEGIVGNNKIKEELKRAVEQNKTSHSYLFTRNSWNWQKHDSK